MTPQPLRIATLAQLLAGEAGAVGPGASLTLVEHLVEAGAYLRRPPYRLDTAALDVNKRSLADAYYGNTPGEFGPIRHVALKDGFVTGQGSVATSGFCLIQDSVAELIAGGQTPDGLIDIGPGQYALDTARAVTVDRPTLLIKQPRYANYARWLVDGAALLALASALTLPRGWQIAVGKQPLPAMQQIVAETLNILAPGIPVVEHADDAVWRVSDLHYVSPVHVPTGFKLPLAISALRAMVLRDSLAGGQPRRAIYATRKKYVSRKPRNDDAVMALCRKLGLDAVAPELPLAITALRALVLRDSPADERPRRAIYVTRGGNASRKLRNEEAVIGLCRELGLEVVAPEQLSLVEQARLFHGAHLVVGVKGAALANALFCSPRTHVVALSPGDFPDPFYWDLLAQAGINYSELFGVLQSRDRAPGENAFSINIKALRAILADCLDCGLPAQPDVAPTAAAGAAA